MNYKIDNKINSILGRSIDKNKKDILILSGGAIKGVAQLGALFCLEKKNILQHINTFACTSIGSGIGLFMIIGYKPLEIFKFMKLLKIEKISKLDPLNIITEFGLDDGSRFILVVEKLLQAKNLSKDITFKELYRKTKINYIVTGSCLNDRKIYYFSHTNYPNMKVLEAIRISIAVPILISPHKFESKLFVDGGCIDNYPIHLFEKEIHRVIGIYVSDHRKYINSIEHLEDYLKSSVQCLFEGVTYTCTRGYEDQTIYIKCKNAGETTEQITQMFEDGYDAADKFILSH
jgi:NTE family protein